jgi:pimeloyl-ACP methyl ester carboxylesterase
VRELNHERNGLTASKRSPETRPPLERGVTTREMARGYDDLFSDEIVEETARRTPRGELHVVENAGHGAFEERKKEFDEVETFLRVD